MESAFRHLDQIRERDDDEARSRLIVTSVAGIIACSLLIVVGIFAASNRVGHAAPRQVDPLDALEEDHALRRLAVAEPVEVDEAKLSFHALLGARDEDEVAVAVEEARRERERLLSRATAAQRSSAGQSSSAGLQPPMPSAQAYATARSAGAQPDQRDLSQAGLEQTGMGRARSAQSASIGSGLYALQIIAYGSEEPAATFAKAMKERGHNAFVRRYESSARGTFWRVLIGPFTTKSEAGQYQQKMSREGHMDSILRAL